MEVTQYEVLYSERSGCGAGLLRVWACISSSSSTAEPLETAAPGQSQMWVRKISSRFAMFAWLA